MNVSGKVESMQAALVLIIRRAISVEKLFCVRFVVVVVDVVVFVVVVVIVVAVVVARPILKT